MELNGTTHHHGSHLHLLQPTAGSSALGRVDAIIVPTVRPPEHLAEAAAAAAALRCHLVTLHSRTRTSARLAADYLTGRYRSGALSYLNLIAIDLPTPDRLCLPGFRTSRRLADSRFARRTDTSTKRNLGLMLSHMMGWERVAFLDDDIQIRDPADLSRASGYLDAYAAVGLCITGHPDNSVVCHAYREAGGNQKAFIGGGALVVETKRSHSFFPDIYNEDWFYVLDARQGLRSIGMAGAVVQEDHDPFSDPDRARAEELGDVLAEGTFWLLDQQRPVADAGLAHWEAFLGERFHFIEQVLAMVTRNVPETPRRDRMMEALRAAQGRLQLIDPVLCLRYLHDWAIDQATWQKHIQRQPVQNNTDQALRQLTRRDAMSLGYCLASGGAFHEHAEGEAHRRHPFRRPVLRRRPWDLCRDCAARGLPPRSLLDPER
jgi:hypothetical protein